MTPPAAPPLHPGTAEGAPPAVFFHPDQVEGAGRGLVGRRSAGTGFLQGWIRHAGGEEIRALTETPEHAAALGALLRERGETRPLRAVPLRGGGDFAGLGCIFFPTPGFMGTPWRRQWLGPERVSLVGLTHTVSTRRIVEGFHALMSEPVEEWDAIICTSRAVRSVVARQFEAEAEYFRRRFGAARVPQPRLPVILLGVDAAAFAPRDGARERMREARGVPADAVVVMTMGRLSVVEKANPVPLLLALEAVAQDLGRPLHLWMTGWTGRPEEETLHREAGRLGPSVRLEILDGRDPGIRRDARAGADIFTLPADSIQETFGLVLVEAMAAGLPVVMPDWDGFRDTVRHGETGFLVPTRMAPPGMGPTLARRFADGTDTYLQHLALVQGHVQIDVPAYARALGALARDPARDLTERRAGAVPTTPALRPGAPNPLELDPFALYADYPSAVIVADTPVHPGFPDRTGLLELVDRVSGRRLYRRRLLPPELALRVLETVAARPGLSVRDLAKALGLNPSTAATAVLSLEGRRPSPARAAPAPLKPFAHARAAAPRAGFAFAAALRFPQGQRGGTERRDADVGRTGTGADGRMTAAALPSDPTPASLRDRALALHRAGRRPEALPLYAALLAQTPGDAAAWSNLGALFRAEGRHDQALRAQERAFALAPRNPSICNNLANILNDLGEHERSLRLRHDLIREAPGVPDHVAMAGKALRSLGRCDEGIALLEDPPLQGSLRHH